MGWPIGICCGSLISLGSMTSLGSSISSRLVTVFRKVVSGSYVSEVSSSCFMCCF